VNALILALALVAQPTETPVPESEAPIIEAPAAPDLPLAVPAADEGVAPVETGLEAAPELRASADAPAEPSAEATLLLADLAFAEDIATLGPLAAYSAILGAAGILYDATGPSRPGPDAAQDRFSTFPPDAVLQRMPEAVRAEGSVGTSWGSYALVQNGIQLAIGRYVSSWERRADGRWSLLVELAAGRAAPPPAAPQAPVMEPNAPVQLPAVSPRVLRDAFGRPVVPPAPKPPEPAPERPAAESSDSTAETAPSPLSVPMPTITPPESLSEAEPTTATPDDADLSNPSSPR
jgi:hypothetical protein